MTATNLFLSMVGGILPALLWLWFWLKEDRLHPEPRRLVIMTFFMGMGFIAVALPLEHFAFNILNNFGLTAICGGFVLLFIWALIEELAKYWAAKTAALNKKQYDEPVDALIYLITAALGFAALENVIFLVEVISNYGLLGGLVTSNLRFTGATLVHILSSATVGSSLAFAFFHKENRRRNLFWGLFFGTLLHALFNYFIIKSEGQNIFQIFLSLWILAVVLLIIFEKVKKLKKQKYVQK